MSNSITEFRLTKQEFLTKERAIAESLQSMNIPQLLAVMGVVNAYTWAALERAGAMKGNELDISKVGEVVLASKDGNISIEMSTLWLCDYLKKHWPGACSTDYSCRQVRAMLSTGKWKTRTDKETGEVSEVMGLGLLEFTPVKKGSTVIPPTLHNIDIAGLAMLYRCAFREWRDRIQRKFPDKNPFDLLPDHKGYLMVMLFDAIFFGMAQFNTDGFERTAISVSVTSIFENLNRVVGWFLGTLRIKEHLDWIKGKIAKDKREKENRQRLSELAMS